MGCTFSEAINGFGKRKYSENGWVYWNWNWQFTIDLKSYGAFIGHSPSLVLSIPIWLCFWANLSILARFVPLICFFAFNAGCGNHRSWPFFMKSQKMAIVEGISNNGGRSMGRSNFLEISDCFDRPPSRQRPSSISSVHSSISGNVRRSSSLQFPQSSQVQLPPEATPNFTFLQTAISHLKYSSASIYASTLSAAGLLSGVGLGGFRSPGSVDSTEAINLYSMMATYYCCFGLFRLRIASLLIGIETCCVATFLLCSLLIHSPFPPTLILSEWQCRQICQPAVFLLSLSMLASLLMLLALITDIHFLILPFMFSCLLNMMASMALSLVFLSNPAFPLPTKNKLEQLYPAGLALMCTGLVIFFLWLFAISSFTFILIRDKRTIFRELFTAGFGDDDEEMRESNPLLLRRSSSAPLDRINSAEF